MPAKIFLTLGATIVALASAGLFGSANHSTRTLQVLQGQTRLDPGKAPTGARWQAARFRVRV